MKKITMTEEIFQGRNQTLPYREFDLEYFEENYIITVDDMIIGNSSGRYQVNIYLKEFANKYLIYEYKFDGDKKPIQNNEKINKDYNDIIQYLLDNQIIKRITPAKALV